MEPTAETIAAIAAAHGSPTPPVVETPPVVTDTPPVVETPPAVETPPKVEKPEKKNTVKPEKKEAGDPLAELGADDEDVDDKLPIDDTPEEDEPDDTSTEDKAGARFKELKEKLKVEKTAKVELQQELAARDARIQELEGNTPELETLRQKVADYEAEMSITKLERTEAYQNAVTKPFKAIETRLEELAGSYEIDKNALFDIAATPDAAARKAALKELTSGLDIDPDDSYEIRKLLSDAQPLFDKKAELEANADTALAELEARREGETKVQAAARAQEREKATLLATGKMAEKLPMWKDIIAEVTEQAKGVDPDLLKPLNQGYNVAAGLALPKIAKAYRALEQQLDQARDELEARKKATPKVGGPAPSGTEFQMPSSLAEGVNRSLQRT